MKVQSLLPKNINSSGFPLNLFFAGVNPLNFYDPLNYWSSPPGVTPPSSPISSPSYSFGGIPDTSVRIQVDLIYFDSGFTFSNTLEIQLVLELWRDNLTPLPTPTKLGEYKSPIYGRNRNSSQIVLPQSSPGSNPNLRISSIFTPQVGDYIYATARVVTNASPSQFLISPRIQTYAMRVSSIATPPASVSSPYWTTGSANSTTLTSSLQLGAVTQGNFKQQDIPSSNFDPIELPCEIQVGDEIRFEYDELNSFKIISVNQSGSGNDIFTILTVDQPIPSIPSLNINNFTIRRKIPDAITGIALDATLFSPISDGFLLPEYPSQTIKSEYSNIIQDLINKSVI
jgi:hypothetical protein